MLVRPLPKSWLIHKVEYEEFSGEKDDWGNLIFNSPITIEYVRFDNSTIFSRDNTQTKVLANGIIFVDAKHSSPIPNFKEESKVKFNNKDYVLKKVIPCYHPNKMKYTIGNWK